MLLELFAIILVALLMWNRHRTSRERELIGKFPGPRAYPIVGNVTRILSSTVEFFERMVQTDEEFAKGGSPFRILIGPRAVVVLNDPKDFEIILGSNKQIDKGDEYQFLLPWLGTGLLTSTGAKWKSHRKILTPTFHFKILEEFLDIFNANGEFLVEKLNSQVNGPGFDIYKYITLYALDNICETAMGLKVNAQNDSKSEYVKAIRDESNIIMERSIVKPWLRANFLFNISKLKPLHDKSLEILHRTTSNVIKRRRVELKKERENLAAGSTQDSNSFGLKKRLAFLDLLIVTSLDGLNLSDEEIREEVDTFMFEGHDTTSSAISFALWLLSWHQDIQDKVHQELQDQGFPDPKETESFRGLSELKYLERVIKETLRLFPSVAIFMRQLNEDVTLSGGLVIPKGVSVGLSVFTSQRNPAFWPDPLKFDPERFNADNIQGRHPYAYVPFSAGPRNCIGQKFAMLEIKSALSHVLRAYKILPGTENQDLVLANELILVSSNGIKVKIVPRK